MKIITQEIKVGGKTLTLEHGRFAEQASSAIVARQGDTMVLVTIVAAPLKMELDYFPLTVDYTMRLYAGGRIKGSRWVKRDGRPTDEEILTCRLIDRSIRPLFPKTYKKDVQVIATVLSVDGENDPGVLAMIAASAALATSNIPWRGPVGSLKIGTSGEDFIANPLQSELETSDLDLVLTTNKENIFMIEAGANQVPEKRLLEALDFGQKEAQKIIKGIEELSKKIGVQKVAFDDKEDEELANLIDKKFGDQILEFAKNNASHEGGSNASELKQAIAEEVGVEKANIVGPAFEKVMRKQVRKQMLSGVRLDGRKHDQIRELTAEVGLLPRTHGSAMFRRGQTQVLSVTTLGAPNLSQLLESAEGEESKRYMHHYNFPPYSTGETGRFGQPGRREIGHGALAERALMPVLPTEADFPYTILVVSEVMSSNGSTSMASTCGSTLSLMDAGVPITAPVSGIAMGLIIEGGKVAILSDIMGIEDGMGDMDFKVTGTETGVTAIQLDVKTPELTLEILTQALEQAKKGRLFILETMKKALPNAREAVSTYAPKIVQTKVPVEKIGEIIGPGGKIIKRIMADTGAQIDVEDDGSVIVSGLDQEAVERAKNTIEGIVKEVQPGEIYDGEVARIQPFGAFVNILPGKDGLVHVSDMAEDFVKDPNDIVKVGDIVKVRVREVDNLGRINLSMRMDPSTDKPREERGGGERRFESRGGSDRGPRGYDRGPRRDDAPRSGYAGSRSGGRDSRGSGGGGRREGSARRSEGEGGGPHFPASRFMPSKKRF
ncbi:MAG: polyribonucleotide nucleotidyltransferase [Microgenomates group bacterium Gr01-1014_5]|nr:MAG: polyribonucleotide nucleotidyltransferase [Microgenomates group bacterium Gr01-1014_5]